VAELGKEEQRTGMNRDHQKSGRAPFPSQPIHLSHGRLLAVTAWLRFQPLRCQSSAPHNRQ
jgi:hypothetical protein